MGKVDATLEETKGVSEDEKANKDVSDTKVDKETTDVDKDSALDEETETEKEMRLRSVSQLAKRNQDMERVAENARIQREKEMREQGIEPVDTSKSPTEAEEEASEPEGKEKEDKDDKVKDDKGNSKERPEDKDLEQKTEEVEEILVIDGKETKVPMSKILETGKRALQKDLAADSRLEEATKILKEAKDQVETMRREQSSLEKNEDADLIKKPMTDADLKKRMGELREAILFGEDDEADDALLELVNLGRNIEKTESDKAPTETDLISLVDQRLEGRDIASKFSAPVEEGGFADIDADPKLKDMAADVVERMVEKEGAPNTWATYQKAGQEVRDWVNGVSGGKKEEDPPKEEKQKLDLKTRLERKKQRDAVESVNAKQIQKRTTESKPKTKSDIINEIRAARGQGVKAGGKGA